MKKASRSWAILCCIAMIIQLFTVVPAAAAAEPAKVSYDLSTTVEAGEKYIIVSNGYALKNEVANVSTANGGISLASAAVTVADGKITSEVSDDMIWDFAEGTSTLAGPYTTGFFITNGESKFLSRGSSGGSGVAPLNTSTYDAENVASKPHYCYWAFEDISSDGSSKSMFLFSSNSSDYVFFLRGAASGFDAPGTSQSNMESSLANYPVQLYKVTTASAPSTYYKLTSSVQAGKKYVIVSNGYALTNEVANVSAANGGISLASTAVTVEGGKITSEVTDKMIWDFAVGTSDVSGPYTTGFFLTNGDSMFLSRASSGRVGVAPLNTNTYDANNVATKPHYSYWSFEDLSDDGTTKCMFLYNITGTEYVFFLRGSAEGFDCPGDLKENMRTNMLKNPMQLFEVMTGEEPEDPEDPEDPEEPDESVLRHELLFMSDTHSDITGSTPNFTNLRSILPLLKADGVNPEVISFGGDYIEDDKAYLINWENVYSTLTGVLSTTYPDAEYVFTTGNHDKETNGGISDAEFKRIFGFDRVGVSCVRDDYEIFHIGAQGNNTSGVDKEIFYEADIQTLDTYLAGKVGSGKVIFIQTHWPMHRAYNWKWRDITNADKVIDTLNKYGDDLDIVFLWGHNHYTDTNRHTIKHPGDYILYAEGASKTIKFTYANVGCMNDFYPTQKSYKETTVGPSVCLSVNIYNNKLVFTYNRMTGGNTSTPVLTHDANITISGTNYVNPAVTEIVLKNPFDDQLPGESTVVIEGTQKVKPGEEFTLNVVLDNNIESVYAGDIILNYDSSLFELKSCDEAGDLIKIVGTETEQPGKVRVLLATQGTAMNEGNVPLFDLDFKTKDSAAGKSGSFTIAQAELGIMPGGRVYSASSTGIDILVEELWKSGDTNDDGVINIGDLAICAYYYLVSVGDPNWNLAKSSDVNNDGIINIIDLAFIAQQILD